MRQRTGRPTGGRPRGRPPSPSIPRTAGRQELWRRASEYQARAEQAERASSDLQRRLEEKEQQLASAHARIAELERLLAEARGQRAQPGPPGARPGESAPIGAGEPRVPHAPAGAQPNDRQPSVTGEPQDEYRPEGAHPSQPQPGDVGGQGDQSRPVGAQPDEPLPSDAGGPRGPQQGTAGAQSDQPQSGGTGGGAVGGQQPGDRSAGPSDAGPRPSNAKPGLMEVRRQLSHALLENAQLRALIEELQRRIAMLERRCAELEQQLQRALAVAAAHEPPASGSAWDAANAARAQERAAILATELEQVRQQRNEIAEQRDRLTTRLIKLLVHHGQETAPAYDAASDALFQQMRIELQVRERYAEWQSQHGSREKERRLDPSRTLDEQAWAAALALRRQLMDHAPQRYRRRPLWVVEGLLLDSASEQFLLEESRRRVAYRERRMAEGGPV